MDTKKLRQKILDLAIRGKLVPQDPNDEPASVLLERIRAEKERLVKEGKIKKSKASKTSDTPHYENVPNGWCITNIGEILINRDGERKPVSSAIRSKQENKIYDYYGAAGVIDKVDDYLFDERLLLIGEDGANLLSRSKNNAFFAEGKYWVNNHAHVLDATDKSLLDYVAIVINAIKLDDYVTGSAQPKLSQDNLNKIPIFLPPLEEQKRVLVEIERWFALIDQIEQGKADLQTFINKAKSKILDLAINGKLVAQDPIDEPASELLKRINPKAEITCDNGQYRKMPFEMPNSWEWCRLKDCCHIVGRIGFRGYTKDDLVTDGNGAITLSPSNIINGMMNYDKCTFISWYKYEESPEIQVSCGDILLVKTGSSFGKCALIEHLPKEATINPQFVVLKHISIEKQYLTYVLKSNYARNNYNNFVLGTAIPTFTQVVLGNMQIPLPPLEEQQRIVAKINELFASLDNIQKALEV